MAGEPPLLAPDDPQARTQHLLALPADVGADEVEVLAASRFGAARWEAASTYEPPPRTGLVPVVTAALGMRQVPSTRPARALRLGRLSRLVGPYRTDEHVATGLGLPAATSTVWRLDCPAARGEAPWPGGGDREGLNRAFPDGLPVRDEERAVRWLVAVARRLHGSVRIAGSGVVLTPDPEASIDLTVLTDRWLEPAETLGVVRRVLPAARPSGSGQAWAGPAPTETPEARRRLGRHGLPDESVRARLSAEADAFDAHWLAHPPEAHAFGVEVDLGLDGMLVVEVGEEAVLPPLLVGLPWTAGGVVAYRVHWEPVDVEDLETERPSLAHRVARGRTAPRVHAVARALHDAVGGEVADEAEFLVHPEDL